NAVVDPNNAILETDKTNNSFPRPPFAPVTVSVRQTRVPHIPYVQITDCLLPFTPSSCYGPLNPDAATEAFDQSRELIRATYPIADIQSEMKFSFLGGDRFIIGLVDDMNKASRIGHRTDKMAERVVALVPPDYFSYHFKTGFAGLSLP